MEKYDHIIGGIKQLSDEFTGELGGLRDVMINDREASRTALGELSELCITSIERTKADLSVQQGKETKEIAKHFFKMDKEMKTVFDQVNKNNETMANIRGKVELTKDQSDGLQRTVEKLTTKFDDKLSKLSILESNLASLKATIKSQQTAAIDGETVATQLSAEKDRLEAELNRSKEVEADLVRNREKVGQKLDMIEENLHLKEEEIERLKSQSYSPNKLRDLIGEEMKDFHDILDDTCGRLTVLEGNKDIIDSSILKEAEKANKNAELLLDREEATKSDFTNQVKDVRNLIDQNHKKVSTQLNDITDNKGKEARALDTFKFELEQKFKDFEDRHASKAPNGLVNGMTSLKDELGGFGSKLDIVKQVEAAEKLAKIEADFIRVRGEVDLTGNKFLEQNRRTVSIEGDISELIVSKDLFQMKLTASETECIELRSKTEELSRTVTNQASKIERMERQIKKSNEDLKDMSQTIDSRTIQLAREKRENEANANFIERMKIEMEMVRYYKTIIASLANANFF